MCKTCFTKKNCRHKYVYDNCYISSSYITHIKLYINNYTNETKYTKTPCWTAGCRQFLSCPTFVSWRGARTWTRRTFWPSCTKLTPCFRLKTWTNGSWEEPVNKLWATNCNYIVIAIIIMNKTNCELQIIIK